MDSGKQFRQGWALIFLSGMYRWPTCDLYRYKAREAWKEEISAAKTASNGLDTCSTALGSSAVGLPACGGYQQVK